MKLEKIFITKFRHIDNLTIDFGDRLTAIAGANGTGKSSILGLIAGIFYYKHTTAGLEKIKFAANFSEIFTFSELKESKKVNEYEYKIELKGGDARTGRFRYLGSKGRLFRIDVSERGKEGRGKKIELPVIYLGLRRLFPTSQDDSLEITSLRGSMSEDEKNWFTLLYTKILATQVDAKFEKYKSINKNFISLATTNYDSFGTSAGQDNLSQILTSFLLFKRLQEQNQNYQGGLFLLDEIDVAMYPGAQITLMDVMQKLAKELKIQVIFTTHSTEIINTLNSQSFKNNSKLIFLKKNESDSVYRIDDDIKIDNILHDIKNRVATPYKQPKAKKIDLYSEDDEARYIINSILNKSNKKRVEIIKKNFGADEYKKLMGNFPEIFDKMIIVLDGDKQTDHPKRAVYIPGGKRPENVIRDFLYNLNDQNSFWGGVGSYNKQVFLSNLPISDDRRTMKQWFNNEKQYWNKNKLFVEFNKQYCLDCDSFNKKIELLISKIDRE